MTLFRFFTIILLLFPVMVGSVPQEDVVGFWTFDLEPGYNLVTFPIMPQNPTVQNVIGDALGDAEISTWDSRLNRYRSTRFDPESGRWSGDLYVLDRGTAYWIRIIGDEPKRLIVTGNPERYTRFRWSKLEPGWGFFAPTFGGIQQLSDLPPDHSDDLIIGWNRSLDRFEMVEASDDGWAMDSFGEIEADHAYIVHLNRRVARRIGPPTREEAEYRDIDATDEGGGNYHQPPRPLIVGNNDGLPVCYADGGICTGGFTVQVIRETVIGDGDEFEILPEIVDERLIVPGGAQSGRFRMVLTVGDGGNFLNPGDRVYLLVLGSQGGRTRSTSFEVPIYDRFIPDISFPEPMTSPDAQYITPTEFALGSPYPNPFNDRFQIEVRLPEASETMITLFDVNGRSVRSYQQPLSAGVHRLTVGSDGIAAGIYFFQIKSGVNSGIVKVAYVR